MKHDSRVKKGIGRPSIRGSLKNGMSFQTTEDAYGKQLDRIFRLLSRLDCWECPCCGEIFPGHFESYVGACPDCWMDDQSLDQNVDLETVMDSEIRRIYDDGKRDVYDSIGIPSSYPPFGLESLRILEGWFGMRVDRARKALDSNCKTLDIDNLTWSREAGVFPRGIDVPNSSSRLAWEKIKRCDIWL